MNLFLFETHSKRKLIYENLSKENVEVNINFDFLGVWWTPFNPKTERERFDRWFPLDNFICFEKKDSSAELPFCRKGREVLHSLRFHIKYTTSLAQTIFNRIIWAVCRYYLLLVVLYETICVKIWQFSTTFFILSDVFIWEVTFCCKCFYVYLSDVYFVIFVQDFHQFLLHILSELYFFLNHVQMHVFCRLFLSAISISIMAILSLASAFCFSFRFFLLQSNEFLTMHHTVQSKK